jgi:uncharacterized protein (TIGR03435 family)
MTRVFAPFVLVVCLAAASDVLSVVKANRSGVTASQLGVPLAGRFSATNVTAADLIAAAYGGTVPLDSAHITGMPSWATRDRFDVEARAERFDPMEDSEDDSAIFLAFAMVRTMLADRFALRVHDGSRVEPVYALVRTARPQPGGLTPTRRDCEAFANAGPFAEPPRGPGGTPLPPCGVRVRRGEIVASGGTLAVLARRLSTLAGVGREVIDATGDVRRYDFALRWTASPAPFGATDDTAAVTASGPSIFTALEEQLGLKLNAQRAPVRVLIIDRVQRPSPN